MSRLGLSHSQFDELTPLELDLALKDHADYHSVHIKTQVGLLRFVGLVLRNKGLKEGSQIRDPRRFYPLWWEQSTAKPVKKEEWKKLDKKYGGKR